MEVTHHQPKIDPGFIGIEQFFAQPEAKLPTSDPHAIRAVYPTEELGFVLDDRAVDILLGEGIRFIAARTGDTVFVGSVWTIERAPTGSKAKLEPGAPNFIPDVAGAYVLTCTLGGGWKRTITVAAYPREVLDLLVYPPQMGRERRARLRMITREPTVTAETIVAGLEAPAIDLATLAGFGGKKRSAFDVTRFR
jgi:hypothetical protein